jgi:hypothetical protein
VCGKAVISVSWSLFREYRPMPTDGYRSDGSSAGPPLLGRQVTRSISADLERLRVALEN